MDDLIATYEGNPVNIIKKEDNIDNITYELAYDISNTATIAINPTTTFYSFDHPTNSYYNVTTCSFKDKKETIFDDKETVQALINRAIIDYYNEHKKEDCITDVKELTKDIIYYLYGDEE